MPQATNDKRNVLFADFQIRVGRPKTQGETLLERLASQFNATGAVQFKFFALAHGCLQPSADVHAKTKRPRGCGISNPSSFAVLIQNLMASPAFLMACRRVEP